MDDVIAKDTACISGTLDALLGRTERMVKHPDPGGPCFFAHEDELTDDLRMSIDGIWHRAVKAHVGLYHHLLA